MPEVENDTVAADFEILWPINEIEGWIGIGAYDEAARMIEALPEDLRNEFRHFVMQSWGRIFLGKQLWTDAEATGRSLVEKVPGDVWSYRILAGALDGQRNLFEAEQVRFRGAQILFDLGKRHLSSEHSMMTCDRLAGATELDRRLLDKCVKTLYAGCMEHLKSGCAADARIFLLQLLELKPSARAGLMRVPRLRELLQGEAR